MYGLVFDLAKTTDENVKEASANAAGGGGRAVKQMKAQGRAVPNLVFQAEDFEAAAFSLGQKCALHLSQGFRVQLKALTPTSHVSSIKPSEYRECEACCCRKVVIESD